MAERDRAAVRIELVAEGIDTELPSRWDDLRGERFVDLDDVDVIDRHARPLERLPRRLDRSEAHDLRLQRRDAGGDDPGQRADPEILGLTVGGDHDRGRAVVERTRVAGGYPPVFSEHWLQGGEHLHRGVRPRPVIAVHGGAVRQRHGDDLAVEEPAVARLYRTRLTLDRVTIHLLARDLLQIGDVFCGLPHRDIDVRILLRIASLETWVLGIGLVGESIDVSRYTLHADREEGVAFAGLDGMERHAAGLQRGGTVAVDGGAGHVQTRKDADHPAKVEALFTGW